MVRINKAGLVDRTSPGGVYRCLDFQVKGNVLTLESIGPLETGHDYSIELEANLDGSVGKYYCAIEVLDT
jgi:hypothetical protein